MKSSISRETLPLNDRKEWLRNEKEPDADRMRIAGSFDPRMQSLSGVFPPCCVDADYDAIHWSWGRALVLLDLASL